MVLSHKCSCGPYLIFLRNIYVHSVLECNHYKALGLNSSATQAEIKSAYYELSKKHHPDKNQGSEKSTQKFRDITAAYEILGNEKLRREYDRGQLHTTNSEKVARQTCYRADYNDEFERKYYERRNSSPRRYGYGKTRYYDFDSWYKAHYVDFGNERFYRNNIRSSMFQEPYYKNPDKSLNYRNNGLYHFLFLFLSSGFIYYYLKHNIQQR